MLEKKQPTQTPPQYEHIEQELRASRERLRERVKELNCLYGISRLVEAASDSLDAILQGTLDLIPPAWQYPEITCARITLGDAVYTTDNFRETAWRQTSEIVVSGQRAGRLDVCYTQEKPPRDEGPFLSEERDLIDAIAERLGRIIERLESEKALRENEAQLRLLMQQMPAAIWTVDAGYRITSLQGAELSTMNLQADQLIGTSMTEHVGTNALPVGAVRQALAGEPASYDLAWSGQIYRTRVEPLRDPEGRIVGALGLAHNVTVQQQTQERLERYTHRLQTLHRIDQAILEAQSPRAIAQSALDHLRQLVPSQRASVTLFDFEANRFAVLATHTEDDSDILAGAHFPLDEFGGDLATLQHGGVYIEQSLASPSQVSPFLQALRAEGIRSFATVPLVVEGRLIGSLNLGLRSPAAFTEEELEIVREVADSLAIAIQQSRLHQAERRRAADLKRSNTLITALGDVAARLQVDLDPNQLSETLRAKLSEMNVNWIIATLNPTEQTLTIRYSSITSQAYAQIEKMTGLTLRDFRIPCDRFPHATEIIEHRRTLFTVDQDPVAIASDMMPRVPRPIIKIALKLANVPSGQPTIYVPLVVKERVTGIMWVWGPDLRQVDVPAFSIFANQVTTAMENAELFKQVRASRERLQALSQRLVATQETERRRLAHELHDEIGQVLTGLKIILEATQRQPADEARTHLRQAQALAKDLITRVRSLSLDLHPPMLANMGLLPTLLWHFGRFTDQTAIEVAFEHAGLKERHFPSEIETAAYRIVQEALTNVARHAGVDEVAVQVRATEDQLVVQVEDAGAGFDPDVEVPAGDSLGLTGMYERAVWLGGRLAVKSAPGAGTRVRAELPLAGQLERRDSTR